MMKRVFSIAVVAVLLVCLLAACGGTKSKKAYTFTVDNGDKIKVELDTTNNFDLSAELPFEITCDGKVLSQGTFIQADAFEQFIDAVNSDDSAVLLDSGAKDGNEYIFWAYNEEEFNYAIRITGSSSGIILGNPISEESARECFERLIITQE